MIYRGTDPANLELITKVKGYQTNSYDDKSNLFPSFDALLKKGQLFAALEDGQTYFYAVSAFNLFGGEGDRSATASARTKPRPPAVPALTASAEQGLILVRWEASTAPDIASYTIFRSKNRSDWSKVETVPASQRTYRDQDLKPDIEYRYRIIAEDKDGLQSDPTESNSLPSPVPKAQG
jgi:fibronectin type 3 domain-containing protein